MIPSIQLAHADKEIQTTNFRITSNHQDSADGGTDTLICSGNTNWEVSIKNFMGHYGHFWDAWIFDLGNYFGFVQDYEHTRGGHSDSTISIIDHSGKLILTHDQLYGQFRNAAFSKNKIWLLHRDTKSLQNQKPTNFCGTGLLQINFGSDKKVEQIPICIPDKYYKGLELEAEWVAIIGFGIVQVKFVEADKKVCLEFGIPQYERVVDAAQKKIVVPLEEFIS